MKIGILTSSRADYGIYLPLLKQLKEDDYFDVEIIAFGTHLSKSHGYTLTDIKNDNYKCIHTISSLISNDDEQTIASSYGLTVIKFADFWQTNKYDLVFCLGDRFEMSAAVQAGIPFGVKFAHLHGGETTLGAIDNIYRHQITHASTIHFTATNQFTEKVSQLIGSSENIHTVGSLSLDGIENFIPLDKDLFFNKFKIPKQDFALITFHPETIDSNSNNFYALEMRKALKELSKKLYLVITMPNADTTGSIYRNEIEILKNEIPNQVLCVENFGKENYFNAMYYSKILIGNTSSGILEAASFSKYVINVGDRQKGRLQSDNCINTEFSKEKIVSATEKALKINKFEGVNIYYKKGASLLITNKIKSFNETI
jgi:GDP/UDP-N,N'-diacetylbacillosamine 2-epimerase (hydrolysing)